MKTHFHLFLSNSAGVFIWRDVTREIWRTDHLNARERLVLDIFFHHEVNTLSLTGSHPILHSSPAWLMHRSIIAKPLLARTAIRKQTLHDWSDERIIQTQVE